MNELQKRFPELYAKLHPEGQFQEYFSKSAEFRAIAAGLPPKERWERLRSLAESKEAKAYVTYRAKIYTEILSSEDQEAMLQLSDYIQLEQELSKDFRALFSEEDMPPISYAERIAGYVLQTIGLYCDAISPQKLKAIRLCFDTSLTLDEDEMYDGEMQPTVDLTFDRDTYHIDIGALWDAPIELERDGRKNAQIWAETVWPEYLRNMSPSPEEIKRDGQDVRQTIAKQYTGIPVTVEFHEAEGG